jgi:2,4-dienoyl-CoA reductase-like NADH-dependent reductase (Old Yellow Enzyme family)
VDIKHCHGYFGHELLSAVDRLGRYGGSLENRTRFLREVVRGIRTEAPGLELAVRLSAFDFVPFERDREGRGIPVSFHGATYPYAFGGNGTGLGIDLTEPLAFLEMLHQLDIKLFSFSAGAAYNSHILRPSIIPSSDGYLPPEDPLLGVARLISVAAELKQRHPKLLHVGTGYTYLHRWLPNVAQAAVNDGKVDFVGIGRMALCYPDIVADILEGKPINERQLCRSCNDCISSMRFGLVSGCYSRDNFYRKLPSFRQLKQLKKSSV